MGFPTPTSVVDWLVDTVRRYGLESAFRRFYGTYRGEVEATDDPEGRGRCRVRVPALAQLGAPDEVWANSMMPGATSGHGLFLPPAKGDKVWVQFENGDPDRPIVTGGFVQRSGTPSEFEYSDEEPQKRGLVTPGGHAIRLDDTSGSEKVEVMSKGGAKIEMDENGSVLITDKAGSKVYLDAKNGQTIVEDAAGSSAIFASGEVTIASEFGAKIEMGENVTIRAPGTITVNAGVKAVLKGPKVDIGAGALENSVLGDKMVALFSSHMHTGNMGAPTSPPTVPMIGGVHTSTTVKKS